MVIIKKKVVVVDDHPLVREGLRSLIDREHDLEVSAEAANIADAMSVLSVKPADALLVDISLGSENGLDLVARVRAEIGELPILVLSMYEEALYVERVLSAGANGYVAKHEASDIVLTAIRRVLLGHLFVSAEATESILRSLSSKPRGQANLGLKRLSNRELEVFRLVGSGLTSTQIAECLHISPKTVETHRARIKEKLGIETAGELVVKAATWVNAGPPS